MRHGVLAAALLALPFCLLAQTPQAQKAGDGVRTTIPVQLAHAVFQVHDLPPPGTTPAPALVLLFTGKAGWTLWEDRVAGHLAKRGFYVLGIDTPRYAAVKGGDYAPDDFAADLERIAEAAPAPFVAEGCPVVLVGRGLGAGAALGGAMIPPPPPRLGGLVLAEVPERSRYGFHLRDRLPFLLPSGEGTFSAAEAAAALGQLPVAHLHADDRGAKLPNDATAWLDAARGPKRRIDYVRGWKNYGVATPPFLKALDEGVDWVLEVRRLARELDQTVPAQP